MGEISRQIIKVKKKHLSQTKVEVMTVASTSMTKTTLVLSGVSKRPNFKKHTINSVELSHLLISLLSPLKLQSQEQLKILMAPTVKVLWLKSSEINSSSAEKQLKPVSGLLDLCQTQRMDVMMSTLSSKNICSSGVLMVLMSLIETERDSLRLSWEHTL